MALAAFFCTLFGVYPSLLYNLLPYTVNYEPYTLYHLTESVQILTFTFIAFWILRAQLAGESTLAVDTDWIYRKPAKLAEKIFVDNVNFVFNYTEKISLIIVDYVVQYCRNPIAVFFKEEKGTDYHADLHRASTQILTILIVFSFVVFALVSLIL